MNSSIKLRKPARRHQALQINPIAAACALLLFAAGAAQAQQAANVLDTVSVTGIRRGIESSIAAKRNSDSIVEAISAEDIGKLPDISIAEALSRLPGLTAQRVDGRAQVIAIRGMSPDFAGTTLNGREQTTTGTNRGVEFDQYPAELISGALVYKTPNASVLGQGLSGTIDLKTIRPLDVAGKTVVFNARGEHNSNGALNGNYGDTSANGGRFSASYIDQSADRTLGIALGFAHLDAPGQQLHYKAWGFGKENPDCLAHVADWGCGPMVGLPAGATTLNGFEVTAVSRHQKRDGLMGVLEYRPNADLHSTVDLYYSTFNQTEVMRGLMGSIGDGWGGATSGSTFSNVATTPVGGSTLVTSATVKGGPTLLVRNDYNTRKDTLSSIGWNTEAKLGSWKGIADLSYSGAKRDETLFETYAGSTAATSLGFNTPTTNGFPTFTSALNYADVTKIALSDPAGWGHVGRQQLTKQDDTLKAINLHAKHELGGIFSEMDAGVNFSQRDKNRDFLVNMAALKTGSSQLLTSAQAMAPVSLGFAGIPGVLSYDVNAIAGQYYTMTKNMSTGPGSDMSKDFGVHEKITTAYAKADIDTKIGGMPLRGNLGVQAVHTTQSSNAFAFDPTHGNAVMGTFTAGTSYSDFLPSLNLVGDLGGDKLVRLGVAKTMARPRIDDMNASSSAGVDPITKVWSGSGGNPQLQPWRATSFDLSFEKYFGKRSYVAVAAFYKDLASYIYNKTIPYNFSGYINPTPTVTPAGMMGTYTTQANGTGGNMHGIEFSAALEGKMLSPSLDGFGGLFTASATDSSIQVNGPGTANTPMWATLPGLSKTVAGLTLYYEKSGYSFRIAERYRSDFRGEYTQLFGNTSVLRTLAQTTVDLQASYEVQQGRAKGLTYIIQVVNATNAADRNLQDGSGFGTASAPQENNVFGRQFLFGVSYKL